MSNENRTDSLFHDMLDMHASAGLSEYNVLIFIVLEGFSQWLLSIWVEIRVDSFLLRKIGQSGLPFACLGWPSLLCCTQLVSPGGQRDPRIVG